MRINEMNYKRIAQEIIGLKNSDLALRTRLAQNEQLSEGYHEDMRQLHNKNASALDEIMEAIGYPTIDKVGTAASDAAWLVIQHAIGRPSFMKKCRKLLESVVSENKADPVILAYLTDRIAVLEGNPQLYGTQFDWDERGELRPNRYDDLDNVNQRRASIGLNTLEEQTVIMARRVKSENQSPPVDFGKRQREMDEWRKSVGWMV